MTGIDLECSLTFPNVLFLHAFNLFHILFAASIYHQSSFPKLLILIYDSTTHIKTDK